MPLRKQKGNMYPWVTHTWNVFKGRCSHDCTYCYMKRYPLGELRFDQTELKSDLGAGNFIFVGSSTDMWAQDVPEEWILRVLEHCRKFKNKYLFQSKNPYRFYPFKTFFPENTILGTTIETNRDLHLSKAPPPWERVAGMQVLNVLCGDSDQFKRMVTIEPIVDFDLEYFISLIRLTNPHWVNIGADSKGHNLPEPGPQKIDALIRELERFTKVRMKDNLKRLKGWNEKREKKSHGPAIQRKSN